MKIYLHGWHGLQAGSHGLQAAGSQGSHPAGVQGLQLLMQEATFAWRFAKKPPKGRKGLLIPHGSHATSHGLQIGSHGWHATGSHGSQATGSHGSHTGAHGLHFFAVKRAKKPPKGRQGFLTPHGSHATSHGLQIGSHGWHATGSHG
ncbi:MAG: hypothetical protein ACRCUY_06020 [Thermoguttaceae bacterium]